MECVHPRCAFARLQPHHHGLRSYRLGADAFLRRIHFHGIPAVLDVPGMIYIIHIRGVLVDLILEHTPPLQANQYHWSANLVPLALLETNSACYPLSRAILQVIRR